MEGMGCEQQRTRIFLAFEHELDELDERIKEMNRIHDEHRQLERTLGGWAGVRHEVAILNKCCSGLNGVPIKLILLFAKSDAAAAFQMLVDDAARCQRAHRAYGACRCRLTEYLTGPIEWQIYPTEIPIQACMAFR